MCRKVRYYTDYYTPFSLLYFIRGKNTYYYEENKGRSVSQETGACDRLNRDRYAYGIDTCPTTWDRKLKHSLFYFRVRYNCFYERNLIKYFLEVIDMKNFLNSPITWKQYVSLTAVAAVCSTIAYIIAWTDIVDRISFAIRKKNKR